MSGGWLPKMLAASAVLLASLLLVAASAVTARPTATPPNRLSPQAPPAAPSSETSAAASVPSSDGSHALTPPDVAAFLDGIVPYAIRRGNIAGATVAVVAGGQIIFAKGYGYADVKNRRAVIADETLFRPGSVSSFSPGRL